MFCPNCGTQAIVGTKFCRNCGTDLDVVSAALTGKLVAPDQKYYPYPQNSKNSKDDQNNTKDPDKLLSNFISNSLLGLAFIVIAIFLTVTNTIGGSVWGFWLLIPGAGSLGSGISSYFKAKRIEQTRAEFKSLATASTAAPLYPNQPNPVLSPQPVEWENLYAPPPVVRNTGELNVPPASVTEGTTRHLQMNAEGETINLPNKK